MIGLDCYLTDFSAAFFIFDFLCKGKINKHHSFSFLIIYNTDHLNLIGQLEPSAGKYYLGGIPEKLLPDELDIEKSDNRDLNIMDDYQERSFMYIPFILHKGLCGISFRELFSSCRKS